MSLHLENLDMRTRQLMLQEVEADITNNSLYISPRLSTRGRAAYPELLKDALLNHNDTWLASQLRVPGMLKEEEERHSAKTGTITAKVPVNAPDTLAEGEFNRFYIRGLCLRAGQDGIQELVIYRAKPVSSPRRESEAKIGTSINAAALLKDIRTRPGLDTVLGLPPGPNSGLSVKLP